MANNCPFCMMDKKRVIHESSLTITIRDGFPVSPGHTLVIPRRHFADYFEATNDELNEVHQALQVAAELLRKKHNPDGFNIGINTGVAAGQTVMHLHVHLIPRFNNDINDPRGGIRWILPEHAAYWKN